MLLWLPLATCAHRYVILRHGETNYNALGIIQGSSDASVLTPKGVEQAEVAGVGLAGEQHIARVYVSPLTRAQQTLQGLALPLPDAVTLSELREIDLGSWEGQDKVELRKEQPAAYEAWKRSPLAFEIDGGTRPVCDLWQRAARAWELMRAAEPEGSDATTLVVAHNAVGQALLCTALGLDERSFRMHEFPNCGAVDLSWPEGAEHCASWRWLLGPLAEASSSDGNGDGGGGGESAARWEARLAELAAYKQEWGNADAPLKTELGRWCKTQRRLHASGKLDATRVAALEALGLSWVSPSDVDDPVAQLDWEEMCRRFGAYVEANGNGQVPKKSKADPVLGGWVAAVRRVREKLGEERIRQLEGLGFEWKSTRKCGSAFMDTFRTLRDFREEHGHCDVARVRGEEDELARWCATQRKQKSELSPKRAGYLAGIGFFDE